MVLQRRRHVPDLANFHRVCETNYMSLMKLMPLAAFERDGYAFSAANGLEFHLRVLAQDLLTAREIEVIGMILKGYSAAAIADGLSITHGTVKVHRKNAYRKLRISSQAELFSLFIGVVTQN